MGTCVYLLYVYIDIGGAPPGIDPSVYQWFLAVDADKSGSITAEELRQALTNGNWSHFNAETCRLMIGQSCNVTVNITA